MPFRLEKCGRMIVKTGKVMMSGGVDLPLGHIADIKAIALNASVFHSYMI